MSRYDINKLTDYEILRQIDEKLVRAEENVKKSIVKYNRLLRQRNVIVDKCERLGVARCASDHQCQIRGGGCGPSDAEENLILEEEELLRRLGYNPNNLIL